MRWTVQSVYWRLESNHDGLRGVVVEDDMVSEEKGSEHEGCDDEEESEKRVNNDVGKGSRSTTRPVAFDHSVRGGVQTYSFPRVFPRCGTALHQTFQLRLCQMQEKCKTRGKQTQTLGQLFLRVITQVHKGDSRSALCAHEAPSLSPGSMRDTHPRS